MKILIFLPISSNKKVIFNRAVESESGAWAYFEESGVGRKKFEESEKKFG